MDGLLMDSSSLLPNSSSGARVLEEGETAIGAYLLLLGWLSWLGNGAVICLMCKRRRLLDSHDLLTLNLAVSDAGISIFGYSRGIVELFHGLGKDGFLANNLWTCQVGGFLILLFGLMSISTLTAISLLRYIKGCQPHKAHMVDQRHVTMAIVFIWISSIFWSGSPVLGWGSFTERKYGTCEIDWVQAASSTVYKSYVIGVFIWGFVLPVSIMVFCYVSIIRTVHKSHRNSRGGEISQRQLTMERDITRVSFVICTAFLLAWSPYAVISMWSACGYQVPGLTGVAATLLAKSASFYNPIIYLGMSPKFRQELRALLCCLRQSGDSPQSFEKPVITHEPKMKQCNSPSNSLAAKMEQPVLGAQGIQESTLIKGAADSLTVNSQTSDPVKNIDISLDFPMESHQI
ncbi:visual pigment-like receptor peropsin [Xenopus tropicalis]|uniref:Visual pigment-like receptor peropsin n=1 Tax=Xenopus tropicalis TaxID=8364 RepID=A0A8J0QJH8_XENTR|nr:visual pigment-like receptor peropsin [Xenopus tropicalis]